VRRLKRRISRRQFITWTQFHKLRSLDSDYRRDHLLALQTIYLARAAGNNALEYDQLIPDPFDATPQDDIATIMQAFQASG